MEPAELHPAPRGWSLSRIDAIATPVRSLVDPGDVGTAEVFHISIPSLDERGDGKEEAVETIDSQKLHLAGDEVLISKLNPRKARIHVVYPTDLPILASGEFVALKPRGNCDAQFLGWLLRSETVRQALDSQVRSVTRSHQRVDPRAITQAKVWIPDLDEQRRIAEFLDAETDRLDRIVRAKNSLLALLTEKRQTVYVAAAAGQLSAPSDFGPRANLPWLPFIPDHWRVAKLTLVAKLGTGHTPSRSDSTYWETGRDIPWITTSDIERFRDDRVDVLTDTKERISQIGLENSAAVLHPKGTVALSRTASVGFSVVMGADMATSQDFVTWTCSPLLEPRFLLICLRAMRRDLVGRLAIGSTHKTIYMPDIESLRISLPPVREQRHIIDLVARETSQLDELADRVNRQLPLFAKRRDALITAAVTGQLDPSSYRESGVPA